MFTAAMSPTFLSWFSLLVLAVTTVLLTPAPPQTCVAAQPELGLCDCNRDGTCQCPDGCSCQPLEDGRIGCVCDGAPKCVCDNCSVCPPPPPPCGCSDTGFCQCAEGCNCTLISKEPFVTGCDCDGSGTISCLCPEKCLPCPPPPPPPPPPPEGLLFCPCVLDSSRCECPRGCTCGRSSPPGICVDAKGAPCCQCSKFCPLC